MKLVLDTTVIFSALIAGGKTRDVILSGESTLYVPEFFFTELQNNLDEVEEKTGLERNELELLLGMLFEQIRIVPREEFEHYLGDAEEHIADHDPDDVPFLALALALDADVWSDDNHFQEQELVPAWKTHELLEKLER